MTIFKLEISLLFFLLFSCKPTNKKSEEPLPEKNEFSIPSTSPDQVISPEARNSNVRDQNSKRDLPPGYKSLMNPKGKLPRDWIDFTRDQNRNIYSVGSEYFYNENGRISHYEWVVYKFDCEGNFLWRHHLRSPALSKFEYFYLSHDITSDSKGNVLVSGFVSFTPVLNQPTPDPVGYVYKINPQGDREWVYHLKKNDEKNGTSSSCETVSVDKEDNIYCAGYTTSSLFDSNSGVDILIIKLNQEGSLVWGKQIGKNEKKNRIFKGGWETCMSLSIQGNGDIFCAGYTKRDLADQNSGRNDAFVLKMDSLGNTQWITQLGATTIPAPWNGIDQDICRSVTVGPKGNIYCAGHTSSQLADQLEGRQDAFITKLKPNGDVAWIKQFGRKNDQGSDSTICYSVKVNNKGTIYCAGLSFLISLNSNGSAIYFDKLSVPNDTLSSSNELSYDICNRIFLDDQGAVFCTGFLKRRTPERGIQITEAFIYEF
ncbi:SBBP repeat-containing protein [Bacteriovoracaceae bacterium]|nr:SBBP repeat-containing protein [Bacteriovoracaceae bacterium]